MSVPSRIRRAIRKRVRARDRYHREHMGGRARREARLVRALKRRLLSWTAPRTQFDAVTIRNIPHDARAVAGYINGAFANISELHSQFPDAVVTSIAVTSSVSAACLDIEPGDATNADAAGWYHRFKETAPHSKPIFYTSASNVAALRGALKASGIKRRQYVLWSAHYTEKRHVCGPLTCGYPKADATQFTTHGETVDESKCRPSYWRR